MVDLVRRKMRITIQNQFKADEEKIVAI